MEDNKPPFAGPYRKASEPRKDQYGNTIKKKNLAKHLAKKAMQMQQQKQMNKEETEIEEGVGDRWVIPTTKAGEKYVSRKAAERQAQADKNDPGSKKLNYGPGVLDRVKAAKKAQAKGINKSVSQVTVSNKRKLPEEVDQLDEISVMAKAQYRNKALKDLVIKHKQGDEKKVSDRVKGIARSAGGNLKMNKEEVEQIDELSREMLGRYSRKAKDGSKDRSKGRELAGRKRWGGTGGISAAKVQATEEVEQTNEARSPRAPSNYAAMMIKKRRKAGTSEFGRHPDKKLSPAQSKHMDTDKDGDIDSTDLKNLRNKK
jgi:hypothetical protein